MKTQFFVTRKDVENGKRRDPYDCPIARSLKRKGLINPKVGIRDITFGAKFDRKRISMMRYGVNSRSENDDNASGIGHFKDLWDAYKLPRNFAELKQITQITSGECFFEPKPGNTPLRFSLDLNEAVAVGQTIDSVVKRKTSIAVNKLGNRPTNKNNSRTRKDGSYFTL